MKKRSVILDENIWKLIEDAAKIANLSTDDVVNVMLAFYMVRLGAEPKKEEDEADET